MWGQGYVEDASCGTVASEGSQGDHFWDCWKDNKLGSAAAAGFNCHYQNKK